MDRPHTTSGQCTELGLLLLLRGLLRVTAVAIGLGIAAAGLLTVLLFWSVDALNDLSASVGKRPQPPKLDERQWADVPRERRREEDQQGPGAGIV